ncbi:hypothetical protein SEPCBS119000_002467 [Sporothrix epigloea]|uniref:Uncharacterized protein n=1 Tax=Sporothrix epigloea TaxID=1892477 RepID=A0ABP0DGC5_9PEZI
MSVATEKSAHEVKDKEAPDAGSAAKNMAKTINFYQGDGKPSRARMSDRTGPPSIREVVVDDVQEVFASPRVGFRLLGEAQRFGHSLGNEIRLAVLERSSRWWRSLLQWVID